MFAIALLVLGLICTVLVWIIGLVKMVCHFNDNYLRVVEFGIPCVLGVIGYFAITGNPQIAGDVAFWISIGFVFVLPILWAIADAFLFNRWLLLPIASSLTCLFVGGMGVL
jgi:uncharacterized membrane protein AbrB (regulator of aidB expression)